VHKAENVKKTLTQNIKNLQESLRLTCAGESIYQERNEDLKNALVSSYKAHLSAQREKNLSLRSSLMNTQERLKTANKNLSYLVDIISKTDMRSLLKNLTKIEKSSRLLQIFHQVSTKETFTTFNVAQEKLIKRNQNHYGGSICDDFYDELIDHAIEEIHLKNADLMDNFAILNSLENELEAKDCLVHKQLEAIKLSKQEGIHSETMNEPSHIDCYAKNSHNEVNCTVRTLIMLRDLLKWLSNVTKYSKTDEISDCLDKFKILPWCKSCCLLIERDFCDGLNSVLSDVLSEICQIKENTEIHKKEKLEAQQNLKRANQAQDLVDEYHILIGSVNYIL